MRTGAVENRSRSTWRLDRLTDRRAPGARVEVERDRPAHQPEVRRDLAGVAAARGDDERDLVEFGRAVVVDVDWRAPLFLRMLPEVARCIERARGLQVGAAQLPLGEVIVAEEEHTLPADDRAKLAQLLVVRAQPDRRRAQDREGR